MPHLVIEHTANLERFEPAEALRAANRALLESGLFAEPDIKSRTVCREHFRVGEGDPGRAFVHVRIALLSGRSDEQRKSLAHSVMTALLPHASATGLAVQLSVETVEIHAASYAKTTL